MQRSRITATALLGLAFVAIAPGPTAAHSDLVASSPSDGAATTTPPTAIVGDFSEPLDAGRSSIELRGPGGDVLAAGGVPDGGPTTRMTIAGLTALLPGTYEVRWTSVTPDDGGVERGTFGFTVLAPTSAPTTLPSPGAQGTTAPGTDLPQATEGPRATTPSSGSTSGSLTPTPTSRPAAPSTPPAPDVAAGGEAGDVLVPLGVLGIILVGGSLLFLRRRQ